MSSSSGSSSASLLTSSIFRMNGTDLVSGLDTDSIIQKLTSGTQSKIDSQNQKEQIAEWKRDAYRSVISQLQTFSNTYFSYTNSSSNLLSSTFFDITSLTSSSSLVKATGSSSAAQNMVIQSISSLASKASYTSSQKVSDEKITSGDIQTEWTKSSVGGKSLILEYEGTKYTVRMGSDLCLDSNDPSEDKVQKIVDELNKQIDSTDALKGNVTFGKTDDGKITLNTTDSSKQVMILDYESSSADTSGKKLLDALGLSAGKSGSSITGSAVDTSVSGYLFNKTIDSDSEIQLNVNGQTHTLTLGADYDISDGTTDSVAKNIASLLQKQIDADDDLKGKITVSGEGGKVSFKSNFDDVGITLEGGSKNLLNGLGLNSAVGGTPASEISGTGIDMSTLTTSYLPDVLSGNSVTFNLDGLSKTISFDKNDLKDGESFNDITGIANYLTRKLNSAFGTNDADKNKITVTEENGQLTFQTSDLNSVLSLSSSDSTNVLNSYGALRIGSGESNRTELTKTLDQLSNELNQPLLAGSDGSYTFSINGKEFKFTGKDTLGNVIAKINDDQDANVTASYSQTTNTFRITYDETGSQGGIKIEDSENGGNLAGVLFGVDYSGILSQASQPDSQTLADLYGAGVTGITANKDEGGNIVDYSIAGTDKAFSGDTVLSSALADLATIRNTNTVQGTDLKMKVALNGSSTPLDIVRASNTTTIDGVTLTVSGTTLNSDGSVNNNANITFSADNNVDDLYKKISDFINDYNKIIDTINNLTRETSDSDYPPLTDAQKKDMSETEINAWEDKSKKGILQNDSALCNILYSMRSAMTGIVKSTGKSLSSIGISTIANDYTSGGQLIIQDTDTLKNAIATDPDGIADMFTAEDGIAQRVNGVLNNNVGTFGGDGALLLIAGTDTRTVDDSQLGKQITSYKNTISDLTDELSAEQSRYWDQFSAMEQSLSVLTSQSSYLSSMMGS